MKGIAEADLSLYVDRSLQRLAHVVDARFFQGTINTVIGTTAPYTVTLTRTGETSPDGNTYIVINPGYTPRVNDRVEGMWRDQWSGYVLWALAGTGATLSIPGHILRAGGTPTLGAGAANGTGPPTPTFAGGGPNTDAGGVVQFGSGTTPGAGAQVVVTYSASYASGTTPAVQLTPGNAATQALGLWVSIGAGSFTVNTATAPAASQAGTTYQFVFAVLG